MYKCVLVLLGAGSLAAAQANGRTFAPSFDPRAMVRDITNPYLPLKPGTELHYSSGSFSHERTVTTVLPDRKMILGVSAVVVHDQVFHDSTLVEDTYDWYAQDSSGNVWYLGEDTRELENGKTMSTEGSWRAGVNGAKPGIAMPASPRAHIGEAYRQEYLAGVAEDMARVVRTHAAVRVSAGTYRDCIETFDWSPLEPKARESKVYCRGVGLVRESEGRNRASELYLIVRRQ